MVERGGSDLVISSSAQEAVGLRCAETHARSSDHSGNSPGGLSGLLHPMSTVLSVPHEHRSAAGLRPCGPETCCDLTGAKEAQLGPP